MHRVSNVASIYSFRNSFLSTDLGLQLILLSHMGSSRSVAIHLREKPYQYLVRELPLASPLFKHSSRRQAASGVNGEPEGHTVYTMLGPFPELYSIFEHERELRQDMEEESLEQDVRGLGQTSAGPAGPDQHFWFIGRHARTVLNFVEWITFTAYLLNVCSPFRKTSMEGTTGVRRANGSHPVSLTAELMSAEVGDNFSDQRQSCMIKGSRCGSHKLE